MIRKAETTRISLVLENDMLELLDKWSAEEKKTRSEWIRHLLTISCNWYKDDRFNKKTD